MIYKLGDICEIYDGPHATPPETLSGPIFLGIKNISEQCMLDFTDIKYLSVDDYVKWTKRVTPQEDDIVFSYEATLNRYALIPKGFYGCLGRRLAIARVKDRNVVNPHFLYHYFCSPGWNAFILANKVIGSTVLRVSVEDFPDYEVDLPDISVQNAVAQVLDDVLCKRNNNNAICAELEAMAKLLYDYWFVQFDFPDENGKPYKSSSGKMVWNEDLKREIPEGWKVGTLHAISKVVWGQCPDGKDILDKAINREDVIEYCSGAGDMRNGFIVDCQAKTYINTSRRIAHKDAVLLSVAGSIGALCVTDHDISLGRAAVAFEANKSEHSMFIFNVLTMLSNQVQKLATGSIQKVINSDHVDSMQFAYDDIVLDLYGKHTHPLYASLLNIAEENQQLTSLRDFLLPMLMNGQVKVGAKGDLSPVAYPMDEIHDEYLAAAEPHKAYDDEKEGV